MNIIFAGTPQFANIILEALVQTHHSITAVLSQPDRPRGRGRKTQPSSVKETALQHNIPVLQPVKLDDHAQDAMTHYPCDVLIVVAYGLIIPETLLKWPKFGCINVHASLLPRWRGAAPIQRAMMAGDKETGITLMQMDKGLDTGDIISTKSTLINDTETNQTLQDRLAHMGAALLCDTLPLLGKDSLKTKVQEQHQATYARKLSKAEGNLDWHQPALSLDRQIRALTPWPGTYTYLKGERIKILKAQAEPTAQLSASPGTITEQSQSRLSVATGQGLLHLQTLQLAGGRAMEVTELLKARSRQFPSGTLFTQTPSTSDSNP